MATAKRTRTKTCERCAAAPATTKLTIGGLIVNGRELLKERMKQQLCDKCAVVSMREFSVAISGVTG